MVPQGRVEMRLKFVLALLLPTLFLALPAVGTFNPLAVASALATALAVCLIQVRVQPAMAPAQVRAVSLRERARLANVLRLHDPGAPGRARPRAPSYGRAAA